MAQSNPTYLRHRLCGVVSGQIAAMLLLTPMTVSAQTTGPSLTISDCQAISDSSERLQCFDALFADKAAVPAIQEETVTVVPEIVIPEPEDFGKINEREDDLTRPVIKPEQKRAIAKATPPKVTSISERVSKIDEFGYKKLRITLENGQVWEQVGSVTNRPPKLNKSRPLIAEIRKASFGSFSLRFNGKGRAIKVRRVS